MGSRAAVAGLCLALSTVAPPDAAHGAMQSVIWSGPERLGTDRLAVTVSGPVVCAEPPGQLHAAWVESVGGAGVDLRYARRDAGSAVWAASIRVAPITGAERSWPGIAVDSAGRVHVVWLEQSGAGPTLRHASKGPAAGVFGPDRRLTDSGARPMPYPPGVAADRVGNVHVVWSDARRGDPDILHRRRDGAGVWSEVVRVHSEVRGDQIEPALTDTPSGELVAVWRDTRDGSSHIQAARLPQFGDVWWPDARLSAVPLMHHMPAVASDGDGVVTAVWLAEDESGQALRWARLASGDPERPYWEPDRESYRSTRGHVLDLAVSAGAGGVVLVAWSESRPEGARIYVAPLTADGALAEARIDGIRALVDGRSPAAAIDGLGRASVLWRGTSRGGVTEPFSVGAVFQRPPGEPHVGQGWLQYVAREPSCGTDGYVLASCDGQANAFLWPSPALSPSLLGSYVAVQGGFVSEGPCPHVEVTRAVLQTSPCPRESGSITGLVMAGGSPLEEARVSVDRQTAVTGPSGRFFLDRVTAGKREVTATTQCALVAAKPDVVVPRGFLATLPDVDLVRGDVVRDGTVDLHDLVRVAGAHKAPPPQLPTCVDLDGDGLVSISDLAIVAAAYGRSAPTSWAEDDARAGPTTRARPGRSGLRVEIEGAQALRGWRLVLGPTNVPSQSRWRAAGTVPFEEESLPGGALAVENAVAFDPPRVILAAIVPGPSIGLWGDGVLARMDQTWLEQAGSAGWRLEEAMLVDDAGRWSPGALRLEGGAPRGPVAWLPLLRR